LLNIAFAPLNHMSSVEISPSIDRPDSSVFAVQQL